MLDSGDSKPYSAVWYASLESQLGATVCRQLGFYAIPDDHNGSIGMLSDQKHIHDMDAWRDASECDRNSITAMPNFVAPERGDFRLQPDSPGNTAADDGGVVGMRQ